MYVCACVRTSAREGSLSDSADFVLGEDAAARVAVALLQSGGRGRWRGRVRVRTHLARRAHDGPLVRSEDGDDLVLRAGARLPLAQGGVGGAQVPSRAAHFLLLLLVLALVRAHRTQHTGIELSQHRMTIG